MPPSNDHLKLIIQRYDTYIAGSNTKAAFLLAFNTFVCGGILTGYKALTELVAPTYRSHVNVVLLLILISGLTCLVFVLRAMYPYMNSGNSSKDNYHSLIFFKSVSEFKSDEEYAAKLKVQSEEETWNDLAKQIYALGVGLKKKYKFLECATTMIYIQLTLILCLVGVITYGKL
jgi:hypothetical protein